MVKELTNPNNRAAFFPRSPNSIAYTGPVDGCQALAAAMNEDVRVYDTAEEAEKACDQFNLERRGLTGVGAIR